LTKRYGFKDEVGYKYGSGIYDQFISLFQQLPLATVINSSVFVVHGGIPTIKNEVALAELEKMPKCNVTIYSNADGTYIPETRFYRKKLVALLWSDPIRKGSPLRGIPFSEDDTKKFLADNKLDLIIRSHECVDGIQINHDGKCVTLFSASHYCRQYNNRGAFARFEGSNSPTYSYWDKCYDPNYDIPTEKREYLSIYE
jgi:diadenosine tetraphosphatase ApaH/serine/threonine PP2A family protein phosphatase